MFAIPFLSLIILGSAFTEQTFSAPTNASNASMPDTEGNPASAPGKLIVTMKNETTSDVRSNTTLASYGHKLDVINGFIVDSSKVSMEQLRADPNVLSVEEDQTVDVAWTEGNDSEVRSNHKRGYGHGKKHGHGHSKHGNSCVTRNDAPWGLARLISHGALKNQDPHALDYEYSHFDEAGEGVDVYVIDTGVRITHDEFGDRARWGATFGGYADADGHGHGTHCAGIVAGKQFGVANRANIIAVKVLNDQGYGTVTDVLAGIDWVYHQVQCTGRPSVASLSLRGSPNDALDAAVRHLIRNNIHVVVSAGSHNNDAKNSSPSRVAEAITVGATDIYDSRAWFSSYGPLVDIFAPGVDITSAWGSSDFATSTHSGTGTATPHITGLVAYIISLKGNMSPERMSKWVNNWGVKDKLTNIPDGTKNLMAHNKEAKCCRHGHH